MSKLAWVTGASSGIGFSISEKLIAEGWSVVISGRNPDRLEEARGKLGDKAIAAAADVTDPDALASAFNVAVEAHGPISALVANAGANVAKRAWGDVSHADFQNVVSANLLGVYSSIDLVLKGMRAAGGGRIIVVSSFAGWHTTPQPGPAYTSTKLAVRGLVDSLNMAEMRNGIVATSLCPGEVATPAMQRRVPPPPEDALARMLQAEDIAEAVQYVLSQPKRVAINELVITPAWNNAYNRIPGPPPT